MAYWSSGYMETTSTLTGLPFLSTCSTSRPPCPGRLTPARRSSGRETRAAAVVGEPPTTSMSSRRPGCRGRVDLVVTKDDFDHVCPRRSDRLGPGQRQPHPGRAQAPFDETVFRAGARTGSTRSRRFAAGGRPSRPSGALVQAADPEGARLGQVLGLRPRPLSVTSMDNTPPACETSTLTLLGLCVFGDIRQRLPW